ncbi:hypothetical protein [Methylobacterium sp. JK268]
MKAAEVQVLANEILGHVLGPLGFERAEVAAGEDQDGDASFFVRAVMRPGAELVPGRTAIDASVALQDALRAQDEGRHAYLSYAYPDDADDGDLDDDPADAIGTPS